MVATSKRNWIRPPRVYVDYSRWLCIAVVAYYFCIAHYEHLQTSTLLIHQFSMGSSCPKPVSFSHALMIFDRNSPQSWRHCPRYCMERPVVDPHMVEQIFVHLPKLFVGAIAVANTLVYHFEQLYGHRTVRSGSCGAPAIVDNPTDCFFNFCFQDLSHIQSFLIGEFNVSSMHVEAMSKELSAAQERISAAASKGGFDAADAVASSELSVDAQRRIAIASGIRSDALKAEPTPQNMPQSYIDSPALLGQGHRRQFLSVRHHLCSHRFFQSESRAHSSTDNVYPYVWKGVEMELGVLAATTSIVTGLDDVSVTKFEALIFSSKRNYSKSNTAFYSHCQSEVCEFTELTCVVNGHVSRATVYAATEIPPLQSVLKCDIKADASTDLVITLSSATDGLQANLHLCALNRSTVGKVVGCGQPWMDAHSLERRYPGLHRAYVLFVLTQTSHRSTFVSSLGIRYAETRLQVSLEVRGIGSHINIRQ